MLWKQLGFLIFSGDKVKNGPYAEELLNAILLHATLAIIKILGILNLTLWKLGEITLLIILQGMLPLKGPTAAKPLFLSKGIIPQMTI